MLSKHLQTIAHGLILVSFMLGLIAAALWFRSGPLEAGALAKGTALSTDNTGIPDSGRQRKEIIDELKALNEQIKAIEQGLKSGSFQIRTSDAAQGAEQTKEANR